MRNGLLAHAMLALLAVGFVLSPSVPAQADPIKIADVKHEGQVDFEKEILPILKRNCLACHNATEAESDLVLETPQTILKGGAAGPSVEPGKSGESFLLKVASHMEEPVMPPAGNSVNAKNLKPQELGLLKLWIDQGATGTVSGAAEIAWQPLPPGVNPIYAVAISPDGQYVACGRANQIFIYHVPSGREVGRLTDPELLKGDVYKNPGVAHLDIVQSLAFSPDSNLLASGGYQIAKLWRRPQNVQLQKFASAGGVVTVSADGKLLASTNGNDIQLFDLAAGKPGATIKGHTAAVNGLAFTPDGKQLYSGSTDKSLRLWNVADGKLLALTETPAEVRSLTLAQAGQKAVTGGSDNIIRLWVAAKPEPPKEDAEKKDEEAKKEEEKKPEEKKPGEGLDLAFTQEREMPGHGKPVTSLQTIASADTQIISGSEDGTLRHWDTTNGRQIRAVNHGAPLTGVAASPDGTKFASASSNNTARLWNGANGQQLAEVKGDYRAQQIVAQQAIGQQIAQAEVNRSKAALDAAKKAAPTKTEAAKKAAEALAAADKTLKEKQAAQKKAEEAKAAATKVLAEAEKAVKAATDAATKAAEALAKDAANDGLKKAKAAADKAKAAADAKFKAAQTKLTATMKPFTDAEAATKTAQGAYNNAKRTSDLAAEEQKEAEAAIPVAETTLKTSEAGLKKAQETLAASQKVSTESEKPFTSVAFSPDGKLLAVGGADNIIHTYGTLDGSPGAVLEGHGGEIQALAFTPAGKLASVAADKSAIVWEVTPAWSLERRIGPDASAPLVDRVIALDFSPDGKLLATGGGEPSRSGELKLWNVADGKLVREVTDAHSDTIFGVEFSPEGKNIASGGADKFLKVFEVATGKQVKSFEGHTHHVLGASWQFDGRLLASCGADLVIKIWNVETGEQQRTIQGFKKQFTDIQFVSNTDQVAAANGDGNAYIRRSSNGGAVRTFSSGSDYMYNLDLTPDGKVMITGGQDSVLRVWNTANGQSLATFEPPQEVKTNETAAK